MIKKFVIDRSKWLNGELERRDITADSVLLDEKGRMCCLGFCLWACGVPKAHLRDRSTPAWVLRKFNKDPIPKQLATVSTSSYYSAARNTTLTDKLILANDNDQRTPKVRERIIKNLFKKIGMTVKFVGEYPKAKKKKT